MIRELFKRQGGTGMIRVFVPVPTIENAICEKNKQLLKEVYTTPRYHRSEYEKKEQIHNGKQMCNGNIK